MLLKHTLLSVVILASLAGAPAYAQPATSANNAKAATAAADVDYISAEVAEDDYLNARPAGVNDPLEGFNRGMFAVNKGVDTILLRPVSKVYDFVMPEFGQRRVTSFLTNVNEPFVMLNSLLQGNAQNTFVSLWRFLFNSTLGVFGLFDMATELGVPAEHDEDFGQTLAVWGMAEGPYVVLPLLGPSTLRDAVAMPIGFLGDPMFYALKRKENFRIAGLRIIDTRSRFGRLIDNTYESSIDPYASFRSLYLQRRAALVQNRRVEADGTVSAQTIGK